MGERQCKRKKGEHSNKHVKVGPFKAYLGCSRDILTGRIASLLIYLRSAVAKKATVSNSGS